MKAAVTGRRSVRLAGVALLAFTVLAPGCGRPPDEAWLRFLGFGDTSSTTSTSLAGELRDGTALTGTANFQNRSLVVGQKVGTGILVHRVRIDYRMSRYSPPSADYGVNLYLAPPAESTPTTGSLSISLAPISLKQWLIDTGAFEDKESDPVVDLTAHLTFYGETDEGTQLEVEGSIAIALTNSGGTSTSTNTTVSVNWKTDAVIDGADGEFTVSRFGSTAAELKVDFTTAGSADTSNDYFDIGTSVLIPAGSESTVIKVIARSSATSGSTVIINLSSSTSYKVGTPASASLQITGVTALETKPTVTVKLARNVSKAAGTTGAFTVYRSSNFSDNLTIFISTSGTTTAGVDYTIDSPVVIPTLANLAEIKVTPTVAGTTGTVIINLNTSSSYSIGTPSNATLNITL